MNTACVIGLGYIGLPTACVLANNGYKVIGIDINDEVINKLNSGSIHIDEPELEKIFLRAFSNKMLSVSKIVKKADIFIISVPTPLTKENKAELNYVRDATGMIKNHVKEGDLIILESTSPPGTTEDVVGRIISDHTGLTAGVDYYLAFCPERVLPGRLVYELIHNDRVIGGINEESAQKAKEVYESFSIGNFHLTDLKTAELVKLAENTYRDINIAFSNELSMICRDYGINIWDVIEIANRHPRVNVLNPGPGVGGHCIPIDPWFILEGIKAKNTLIERARGINNGMPAIIADRILEILKGIDNPKVTIFGASYKENVDDTRESPTIDLVDILKEKEIATAIYDPVANTFKYELSSLDDSLAGSDLIVLLIGHKDFKKLNLENAAKLMRTCNIFDTRNYFNPEEVGKKGFKHISI